MENWNSSYFGPNDSQNYGFIPPAFASECTDLYQNGSGNWPYYPVNPNLDTSNNSTQPLGSFCQSTPSFYNSVISQPVQESYSVSNLPRRFDDPLPMYTHSEEEKLAIAAASSLTATAGEFVPRSRTHYPTENGTAYQEQNKSNLSEGRTNYYNRNRGGISYKRPGNESRNFQSGRSVPTGSNRDYTNGRRGGKYTPHVSNSRSFNMDDSKSQDRQRLLAEAAAFLTPPSQEFGNTSAFCDDEGSMSSEIQSAHFNFGNVGRERDTQFHQKVESNYNKGDVTNRVFTNSKYNQANYDSSPSSRNYVQPESYNKTNKWRAFNSQTNNYKNEAFSSSETFSNAHSSIKSPVGKFESSKFAVNGTSRASPRKEIFQSESGNADDDVSQRERLAEQLSRATLECLVCCERVRQYDPIWSCTNCYHVLHLKCIKKWAKSSKAETGWRCPACQNVTAKIPQEYRCFCGKARDPEWNRQDTAHTCGEVCGKSRTDKRPDCVHRCTLLCHPGPCPTCVSQVNRNCGCGKTSQVVKCGSEQPLLCGATCEKILNCTIHKCSKSCHVGSCGECEERVHQVCYCGKVSQEVPCTAETCNISHFSCGGVCDQTLTCGHHNCTLLCHEGSCTECTLTPEKVTHCPCGKTELTLEQHRESCLDVIPTCDKVCEKELSCGPLGDPHHCKAICHTGTCPSCPLTTFVKCRCGHIDREISCQDLATKGTDVRCEKKCVKKRSCGKHKCNQMCCIDIDHRCPLACNHMLSCGQHRCEELCHRGHCQPCWRTSFEELYCECGASVLYPPIPCGTRPPACSKPCSRQHECDHPALHNCHSELVCPPCTVLVQRYCYGKHELRKSVPCHQTEISCGMPCNNPLSCGRHRCILPCHKGVCLKEGRFCTQPCPTPRALCGHPCAAPCHDGPCPDTPCKEMVKVTCECGHRSLSKTCCDNAKEYQRIATALLASKMADMQLGHSVDISDLKGIQNARAMSLKTLDCNDECKLIERNRRLAICLQIRNPDLTAKLTPRYSDFMRQWAKKDPNFCNMVHEKLTELVQLAKQSKQKSRSYSFDSMNRDKRHFIHEYCEHFGCESQAYDQEPKRNVVATASKDRAWLPSMGLLEVLQRESGQRKVPKPVINTARASALRPSEPVTMKPQAAVFKTIGSATSKEEPDEIDYFELTS